MSMHTLAFFTLLAIGIGAVVSPQVRASDEDWRVKRLNERYDDFFARRKQLEEYEAKREAGASEVEKENAKWDEKMNKAREQFIASRPPPPNLDGAYQEWVKEQEKFQREHEQAREHYVSVEQRVENLEKSAKKIPEDLEYDLDNTY